MLATLNANETNGITAQAVADTVVRAIETARLKPLYAVGSAAPVVFALRRLLPRTAVERLVS
ncbi:hypothetical protein ACFYW6_40555 [Streptomyces sp. NPDC002659]|uniref:hypothetical protein n=1 Tax=Streptomyces sp. NPDC002659 TaxID=3364656 RepID=UPI0036B1D675